MSQKEKIVELLTSKESMTQGELAYAIYGDNKHISNIYSTLMEHINIAEFNRGQSSKILREISEDDKTAFIQKNGKPLAVVMSYDRYQRLYEKGVDITEF